jgi:hypothetical protein
MPLITCGDININYLTENENKTELDFIMDIYNLKQVTDFPERKNSEVNNIFPDEGSINRVSVCAIQNGLSDHDVQFLLLDRALNIPPPVTQKIYRYKIK